MAEKEKQAVSGQNFNSTANLTTNTGFKSTLSISSKNVGDQEKAYNPFENRQLEHPNSTLGSIAHLLKACLGSGILAMPAAFKNAGLLAGTLGTIIAGYVCTHTVHMVVKTSQDACVDARTPSMGFAETCGAAFKYGPKGLQKYSDLVKQIVDYSMAVTYVSILCVYVVFIGSSFKEALDRYYPDTNLSIQAYCALTLVPLVLICQIRNLKYLVPFSTVANLLIVIVFGITLYYVFFDLPPISEREMVVSITQWPLFLSTVIFAMEGIGVVMPVENEMANPQHFLGCPGVLNVSMVIVITLYAIVGFFGYVQFGDLVKGSITLSLPQDDIIAQSAKIIMAIVIYFSYALQFYVPMEFIQRLLKQRGTTKYENVIQVSIRTILVTCTVAVAAAFPNLEFVISLVGAIFLSTLGLFIPAVIETVYRWDRGLGKFNYVLFKNIIIAIFSLIALFSGSYVSILGIIEESSVSNHNSTLR